MSSSLNREAERDEGESDEEGREGGRKGATGQKLVIYFCTYACCMCVHCSTTITLFVFPHGRNRDMTVATGCVNRSVFIACRTSCDRSLPDCNADGCFQVDLHAVC